MSHLNFVYGSRVGVGYVISYAGVPQFSIAWTEGPPERKAIRDADHDGILVDGKKPLDLPIDWENCCLIVSEPTETQVQETSTESAPVVAPESVVISNTDSVEAPKEGV